jgi:hypothetical protein
MACCVQVDVHLADVPGQHGLDVQPETALGDAQVACARFVQNQAELGAESAGGGGHPDMDGVAVREKGLKLPQGAGGDADGIVVAVKGCGRREGLGRHGVRHGHGASSRGNT